MTDTEKAALERRIDELCAEVERLHADQAHWELGNCPSCPNIADLQEALEQNAKLRELVRILAYCMSKDCDCDKCMLNDADMPTPRISACDSLPDRIRELGIEVG